MDRTLSTDDGRNWVRLHVLVMALITGAVIGLVIIDGRIGEFVDRAVMPQFRSMLLISVLSAGIGARAILARNTATVDTQGWVFLVLSGLLFLAVAAWGFTDCFIEVRDAHKLATAQKSIVK